MTKLAIANQILQADVVVVGSGLAGALVSYQLASIGIDVLCLEAGPAINRFEVLQRFKMQPDRDFQECYVNTKHAPFPSGKANDSYLQSSGPNDYTGSYIRGVGGTTWHWAGHAWRFLHEDFQEKSLYGVGRDMPVTYDELESYYTQAENMMGVSGVSEPLNYYNVLRKHKYPLPPLPLSYLDTFVDQKISSLGMRVKSAPSARNSEVFDQRPPCCGSNNCMPICPVGAQYAAVMHLEKAQGFPKMRLISNAVVNQIITNDDRRIEELTYLDPQGVEHRVSAQHFVLAAGAIEIPKLLLMSNVGNDQVGRHLMDHPQQSFSFLAKEDVFPGRGPMVVGSIINHQTGAFRSERAGFRLNLKNFFLMDEIVRQQVAVGGMGARLKNQIDLQARRHVGIEIFYGQLPDANNRVVLSQTKKDALGLPHPEVHYTVGSWTEKSVKPAYDVCESIAKACGYQKGSLMFESEHKDPKGRFNVSNHIMGTTVMGNDPKDSATDSLGRVYSRTKNEPMENLFIASSSLLGATGVSNVSLTIAALALRLAEHLKETLGRKNKEG
jgi:choline dehydrogenase-like flavoprotein